MEVLRKPFQGIFNVVRFNWHFYLIAILAFILILVLGFKIYAELHSLAFILLLLLTGTIAISLFVTFFVYDLSGLYKMEWIQKLTITDQSTLLNVHAGFDETSLILQNKFPQSNLTVLDFYDPIKNTEISIERARKAYPPFPGTKRINSNAIPLEDQSIDFIFLILSAHEIRNDSERDVFFRELNRVLKISGKIIVTEHLRDWKNFCAYTFGFFHFHSEKTWKETFKAGGFKIENRFCITPFITTFILEKNGATA